LFISFEILILLFACYLIGSIPFGLLFSLSISKNDPRLIGSKNIGATNITRISGWKIGLLTLLCDIFKGFLPVFIFKNQLVNIELMILSIFLGHLFPIWIRFKGGKGIAVLIGCLLAYEVTYGLLFLTVWFVVAMITKYSSLSALTASLASLLMIFLKDVQFFPVMMIIVFMIFIKHSSNIKRLINGKETKIVLKK
tara:strand:+ start:637 stop:1224 length:588 start_codon:yes stop_codon:yes gene_type:complete